MKININNKKQVRKVALVTGVITFSTVFLLTGLLMTQVFGSGPTFDDKLTRLDAAMNNAVDSCLQQTSYLKTICTDQLEESWWGECSEFFDKLDTCKNGKIENFLKEVGRPT